MLIKVGNVTTLNMSAVKSVHIRAVDGKAGPFWKRTNTRTWEIQIFYKDMDSKEDHFTLMGFSDPTDAVAVKNSILSQIKEADLERVSNELESALRNG